MDWLDQAIDVAEIPQPVWVATRRHGIDRHLVVNELLADRSRQTVCGRSTRTGEVLRAGDTWVLEHTTRCPDCWPDGGA